MKDWGEIEPSRPWSKNYRWLWLVLWTAVITGSLLWNLGHIKETSLEVARVEARAAYEEDVTYRSWNALHGGVYVPVTEETPPNPYLNVPERDITTPSGRLLTLMNPAYMTRQVHEIAEQEGGMRGHLTSLNPIRPENAPDPWETRALQAFQRGKSEFSSVEEMSGQAYMRLMRPLIVEKSCLQCHAAQGYQEGDIRGGLSISVPMAPVLALTSRQTRDLATGHVLLWLMGLVGIVLGMQRLGRSDMRRAQTEKELRQSEHKFRALIQNSSDLVLVLGTDMTLRYASASVERIVGHKPEDVVGKKASEYVHPEDLPAVQAMFATAVQKPAAAVSLEVRVRHADGRWILVEGASNSLLDDPMVNGIVVNARDITERKQAEEALHNALKESQQRQAEIVALLESARAVLEQREFAVTARAIFNSARDLMGATGGYVSVLSEDGSRSILLFLDPGDRPCYVDSALPMPIRGLRGEAYRSGKTVYDNHFLQSEWARLMPPGHVALDNVLFAPLLIEGKAVGLLGLGNKSEGFSENDARLATAFADLTAVALRNSRLLESLQESEERFRSVVETAKDAIVSVDSHGDIVFWNRAAEDAFGYSAEEVLGKPAILTVPERLHQIHQKIIGQLAVAGKSKFAGRTIEGAGLRKDGSEFPLEVSLAKWETGKGVFVAAIFRDLTERQQAEEERRKNTVKQNVLTQTVRVLVSAIEQRDPYIAGHQQRAAQLASAIAGEMGLSSEQIAGVYLGGLIHDVGKVSIPGGILNHPGKISDIELRLVRTHAQAGYDILKGIEPLEPIARMVLQHHERMDGSGYPQGLRRESIIQEARILAVAEVVEAMCSHRPYRPALGIVKALEEISQKKGVLYDPAVVDACLVLFDEKGFKFDT